MIGIIIFLIITIGLIVYSFPKGEPIFGYYFLLLILIFISVCLGGALEYYSHSNEPEAIDVYRGNTQLEITETVRDSVVVSRDTVIIFKTK